jgi:trigger factor
MKHTLEKLPKSRVKLTIEVPQSDMVKHFEEAYKELAPTVDIKGFRPGFAPKSLTLEAIGFGRYQQAVLDKALPVSYTDAIKENKIYPIHTPAVAIKQFGEGKDFIFEAEVDIIPQIKLADYKKIKVKDTRKKQEAKKEEIEKILKNLQYKEAKFNPINRAIKKGDWVEIDYEGAVDKVKQENLASKNYPLIVGENTLLAGFEENLIGLKKNDKKEFDLEVPSVQDRKKTKRAHFIVKINEVKETILPELNNEFVKKFGHDTLDKLKTAIEESVIKEKEMKDLQVLENEILNKIVEKSAMEVPESLIDQEINRRISQIQAQTGPGFESFLQKIKKTMADLRNDLRKDAEKSIKIGLILGEIAKAENLAPKHPVKDQKEQMEITRKTLDKLINYATKKS